jgi:hypothetical protein
VEREAARLGHLCLVCSTDGDLRQELDFIETMRAQRAAAVILVGGAADAPSTGSAHVVSPTRWPRPVPGWCCVGGRRSVRARR